MNKDERTSFIGPAGVMELIDSGLPMRMTVYSYWI
jgi:hypothetical protein